jgi:ATP-dependent DNA helicase DinG
MTNAQELENLFTSDGPIAKIIDGYLPRTAQVEMAQAIAKTIHEKQNLIAEAGTGTGKTIAYLLPAILSGKKVIISTGTKNLQDQLFNKDLPVIRKALSIPFSAALLKGRNNYLCLYRLHNAMHTHSGFSSEDASALAKINRWSGTTRSGDITDMPDVPESSPAWFYATSTVDNCLGQDCPNISDCHLVKARKHAQEAEIVVVNHHLLCADWSIREIGFGELLPDADVIIIDEAHQLSETASNFLGISLGAKQFNDLAEETLVEYFKDATDMPDLRSACENLQHEIKKVRLAFGMELKRGEWQEIEHNPKILEAMQSQQVQMKKLTDQLQLASVKTKGLESCFKRSQDLEKRFQNILQDDSGKWIRWYETHKNSYTLNCTPLDIAAEFQEFMKHHQATWIFTSATLSVAQSFDHFANNLGITDAESHSWESPFNYAEQSLFYHPRGLVQPSHPDFTKKCVEFALPVLQASQGRAFFLFTSYRGLNQAAELLKDRLDYPLLIQGTKPKSLLLEQFKKYGNAVLLGTSSFWQGVDVRGDALSCVIIDKLPFASPGDPVLKARLHAMELQGKKPFFEHQIPHAVIALRQGIGRLIRDVNDRGILLLCDPRLLKRSYGQIFLDSVPPMKRTRDIEDVKAFFRK